MASINSAIVRAMTAVQGLRVRLSEERGQDLLEYALLGGLLAAAIAGAALILVMSGAVTGMANGIAECINFSNFPAPCTS